MMTTASLIKFPIDFPIKIIGKNTLDFESQVLTIIHKHFPNLTEGTLQQRASSQAHYLALTVTVRAYNQQQLDDTYRDLSVEPLVLMAL